MKNYYRNEEGRLYQIRMGGVLFTVTSYMFGCIRKSITTYKVSDAAVALSLTSGLPETFLKNLLRKEVGDGGPEAANLFLEKSNRGMCRM